MEKEILICGGCSFTAGGGFDDPVIFEKEFGVPLKNKVIPDLISSNNSLSLFIKDKLWPSHLKTLTGHDEVYNCAIGGQGIDSTLNFFIDLILELKEKFPNSKIDAIYQIPESAREEVWVDKFERPVSILTHLSDESDIKKNYYSNFFNDEYAFFNQIQRLYRFKKTAELLNINVHLFCWDEKFTKNSKEIQKLKNKMKFSSDTRENQKFWYYHLGNVFEYPRISLDKQLKYLNVLEFDGHGINWHAIEKYDNFTFEQKYKKDGIYDTHASKDGMKIVAKILYEKIFK